MANYTREIREYWEGKRYKFALDAELLDISLKALEPQELAILQKGRDTCKESEALYEAWTFLAYKVFNRHNDIASRYTILDDSGELTVTEDSAITELDISLETMRNCNKSCVYKISDIKKDILPTLTFEAIAEITTAILAFNEEHSDAASD